MFKVVLKFVLPVTVAGAGGATAFGPSSKNPQSVVSNLSTTLDSSSSRTQAEVTLPAPVVSQPAQQVVVETQALSSEPEHIEEIAEKFEATTTGNCRVVNDQQSTIDKLPKEQTYISFVCQNPRVSQAILTD